MSKKFKHTPGPWHLINDHCVGGPESSEGAGHGIAMCGMRARGDEEAKANARLIASAPDLLDSLSTVLALAKIKYGNLHDDVNEVFAKADAAIAKARGE